MEKMDRRIRKTQQALGDALVALILEKGYDPITIKEITDRADVAHATFYRHYHDKDELLRRKLEELVGEIEALTKEPALQDAEGYLIFKHAQENSSLYQILLSSEGTLAVRKWLTDRMAANTLRTCKPLFAQPNGLIPPQVAAHHIAGSLLLLIEWWLDQKMPYPPHHMAKIFEQLIANATLNAIRNSTS
ncbi:MAG: TetR/AcrR family transcriptional regulator [Anaerolineae bacterium]|nr:TetR/AcrR family transcriptional regulator [Anaerolineae bacterium]